MNELTYPNEIKTKVIVILVQYQAKFLRKKKDSLYMNEPSGEELEDEVHQLEDIEDEDSDDLEEESDEETNGR